ncbi:hypothetical protein N9L06_04345 [Mariniblastus sp.]|nr:hypothetical protein [Mariniblastus sp.]
MVDARWGQMFAQSVRNVDAARPGRWIVACDLTLQREAARCRASYAYGKGGLCYCPTLRSVPLLQTGL